MLRPIRAGAARQPVGRPAQRCSAKIVTQLVPGMHDDEAESATHEEQPEPSRSRGWQLKAIGWGAAAAVLSAVLAITANLSELAGWFAPDETHQLVEQTRASIQNTDEKVEELLALLRNQAAASGLDLNMSSDAAMKNAIEAIIASGNAGKQAALDHLNRGDVQAAADRMRSVATNQASAASRTTDAAADTWHEAGTLYYTFDIPEAVRCYREADRLRPDHPPTLDLLGFALMRAGSPDDAERVFARILQLKSPPAIEASAQTGLGWIAKTRGNYPKAHAHYADALDIAESNRLTTERVGVHLSLGQLYVAQGSFDEARRTLRQGLDLAEEFGENTLRGRLLSAMGVIAAREKRFDDAEHLLQQAVDIHSAQNDFASKVNAIGNLGAVALSRGDFDTAETLLLESAELSEQLGWKSSVAHDLVNLAAISSAKGDFATADRRLGRAQRIAEDIGLAELVPVIVFNRGEIARDADNLEAACSHWLAALPMMKQMGSAHVATAQAQIDSAGCGRALADQ